MFILKRVVERVLNIIVVIEWMMLDELGVSDLKVFKSEVGMVWIEEDEGEDKVMLLLMLSVLIGSMYIVIFG